VSDAANPLWITEADVVSMMDLPGAIAALEAGLAAEARGEAQNMLKTHAAWGKGDTLHAIGATFAAEGFVGTKTWAHTEGGATPLLVLFDAHNGSLRAIIEAFGLGQMRTAGASGVATKWLAANDAAELAMIGTGKQSLTQVAAVVAVRPIRRVRIFGRDAAKRAAFAERVRKELQIEAVEFSSIAEAVKGAAVVSIATRATEPIVDASMLSPGTHVNAIGAIVPSRAEIAQDVFRRASCVVADTVTSAQKLSRELIEFYGKSDDPRWSAVQPLSQIVASRRQRTPNDDITLFKSLGMGISDLALGTELYRRAVAQGIGRELPAPKKVQPRLRSSQKTSA
jgi:alanine dehydrogenase